MVALPARFRPRGLLWRDGDFLRRIARALGIGPALMFGAAPRGAAVPLLALAKFVWSFGAVLYFVNGITLIQTITPERLLGRVNASRRFAVWGVIPLGSLTGGAIASLLGLHTAIWIGAAGATLSVWPLITSAMPSIQVTADAELLIAELNEEAALGA